MIVITGAAGFIGSCLVSRFNELGQENLLLVDDFTIKSKEKNLKEKKYNSKISRSDFFDWLNKNKPKVEFVFHIGARTDTTEFNKAVFNRLNVEYSKDIWNYCTNNQVPLVYASSAATYGLGENGYKDKHDLINQLKPLNPYGDSKNEFDICALKQTKTPPNWYGLKFFNVYGPNEYHKGRMASVIFHAFKQINETNKMNLFRSHNASFKDGEQLRDFIYVKDILSVCLFLQNESPSSGIYNLGSGNARSFNDLVINTFKALDKEPKIEYIDTPLDIRDKYQYFTEADMSKLRAVGYKSPFTSLEKGVKEYITDYLNKNHSIY
ncbi:MAG: ADP-glyceromanno-heptose 6-epimerase [Crocinitomicaceae bacterium]|nr:ADP-glyceromanno-heptose 6-epimerase [Crocinitomicaceae bacterium]